MKKLFFIFFLTAVFFACKERRLADASENLLFDFANGDIAAVDITAENIAEVCVMRDSFCYRAMSDSLPPMYISNFYQVYFDTVVSVCSDSLRSYGSLTVTLSTSGGSNASDGDGVASPQTYQFFQKQNNVFKCYVVTPNKDTVIMPFQAVDRILAIDRYY